MRKLVAPALIAAAFITSTVVFPRLPDTMATHWNLAGEPDGWSSRTVAAFFAPTAMLFVWVLLRWLPTVDPRRANLADAADVYGYTLDALLLFFLGLHVTMLGEALGWPVSLVTAVPVGIGLLLVLVGVFLPRVRPNYTFGIRTPWTLASDRVWARTHRVGGPVLVVTGLVMGGGALVLPKASFRWLLLPMLVAAAGTVYYSYRAWREEAAAGGGPAAPGGSAAR
ncbi:MAG TPA: SdpI family protein [Gemmatimonadaceae bacterium]|nr:SdpI family protein [Gemmatimonadaceae bacterium]